MTILKFAKGAVVAMLAVVVIAPSLVLAQATPLVASIDAPINGSIFDVNEAISFRGSATGGSGDVNNYQFNWTWGDGTSSDGQNEAHTYTVADDSVNVTLRVTDHRTGQTSTDTVNLNIGSTGPCTPLIIESPVSAQPRAENVTRTTAEIVWTTCESATSRVVYDTVRHRDASEGFDQNATNLGYAFSTTRDDNKVTTHRVLLTGLTPNTTYYFRVLSQR